jgi:leader peptidase (prepilin peptidase)/N-methyltransferase
LLTSALIVLSVIDFRTYEIPLGVNIFILALGLIRVLTDIRNWQTYLVGLCAVSIVLAVLYYATKGRAIGGGDVKLMAACGLLLGWKLIIFAFLLGCVLGAVIHVIRMKVSGESRVLALGPYLSMGTFIAAIWGNQLISWYFGQFI